MCKLIKISFTKIVIELTTTTKVEDNDLKVEDKVILEYSAAYKYKTAYKGSFVMTQCVDQCRSHITIWCNKS